MSNLWAARMLVALFLVRPAGHTQEAARTEEVKDTSSPGSQDVDTHIAPLRPNR
ncbi:MAG: hypothetical protein MUE70_16655 [Desulfobacterales bacterium]|nr:hypothetical protein [Desulfobacterales bacterium]